MNARTVTQRLAMGFALLGLGASWLVGQTFVDTQTKDANGNYLWTPIRASGTGLITDLAGDLQTGQQASDMLGTASNSGFMVRFGQINLTDSVAFRLVLEQGNVNNQGVLGAFNGRVNVAMDVNNDGKLDIVVGAAGGGGSSVNINYQIPDSRVLNVSPSTTSLNAAVLLATADANNFNYSFTSTLYPSWVQVGTTPDVAVTFAVTMAQLNTALVAAGFPQNTVSATTWLRLVAFTATQANAINQDVYGLGVGGATSATRFDAFGGGFSDYTNVSGDVVPEPATVVSLGASLACGLAILWRRRRRGEGVLSLGTQAHAVSAK